MLQRKFTEPYVLRERESAMYRDIFLTRERKRDKDREIERENNKCMYFRVLQKAMRIKKMSYILYHNVCAKGGQ